MRLAILKKHQIVKQQLQQTHPSVMPICKNCKGTQFERDLSNANNDLVCKDCGVVSEDNPIVSEVTFGESSSGAAVVQGSFIQAGQAHASFGSIGGSNALASRENTLNNARRKLRAVSHALNIPDYITDAAFQWYKLSLAHNFVQGRKSQNIIASCLYVACRKEKTPHMLIDFSSRLQVSVYSIGATFLKMVKKLHITNLPLADPSLFIQHFAEKLDLGEKKIKVVKDAVKLAAKMSDEWMFEGRRPAGIAGACILLACRMNNLRRTHSEIVAVSHVAEETLQERLIEFKKSKSSKMSVKEFRLDESSGPSQNSRPPSFTRNRKSEKKIKEQIRKNEQFETSEEALNRDPILSQVLTAQELSSKELVFYLKEFSKKRQLQFKRLKATNGIDDEDLYKNDMEKSDLDDSKDSNKNSDNDNDNEIGSDNDKNQNSADQANDNKDDFVIGLDGKVKVDKNRKKRKKNKQLNKKKFIELIEYNIDDISSDSSDNDNTTDESDSDSGFNLVQAKNINANGKTNKKSTNANDSEQESEFEEQQVKNNNSKTDSISTRMRSRTIKKSEINQEIDKKIQLNGKNRKDNENTYTNNKDKIQENGNEFQNPYKSIDDHSKIERNTNHFQDAIDGYSLAKDPYRPRNLHLLPSSNSILDKVNNDPDNLSDVDDDEINGVILDEEASKLKERIWIGINEEYLLEQESKRLKEEADLIAGNTSTRKKRKPRKKPQQLKQEFDTFNNGFDNDLVEDKTAAGSVKNLLQKTSFSKKINYDAIEDLFNK